MIIDNLLVIHNTTVTVDAATTSYIDQTAANVAIGNELYCEMLVTTTMASSGKAATLIFKLQGDSDAAFGSAVDLAVTPTILEASLVAGYVVRLRIPIAQGYRYIRGYFDNGTEAFTSGAVMVYFVQTPYERV